MKPTTIRLYFMLILLAFIITPLFCQTVARPPINFTDTDAGTAENPYIIENLGNLRWLSECSEEWWIDQDTQVHFLQTEDIDATETASWNGGAGFHPIGHPLEPDNTSEVTFVGVYDGAEKIISNLCINQDWRHYPNPFPYNADVGLFGKIRVSDIKNIVLENIIYDVYANYSYLTVFIGGVVGSIVFNSTVTNCQVTGSINIISVDLISIGGITGYMGNDGSSIDTCQTDVDIVSTCTGTCNETSCSHGSIVGGITGYVMQTYLGGPATYANIVNSHSAGSILSSAEINNIGGVTGATFVFTQISSCSSTMDIECSGEESFAGGISSHIMATSISKSFYSGSINSSGTRSSMAAGVAANVCSSVSIPSSIANCYSRGEFHSSGGLSMVGGITSDFYQINNLISNCYSATEMSIDGSGYIGGLSGGLISTTIISNCLWDMETAELSVAVGVNTGGSVLICNGLLTDEMKQVASYTNIDWNFNDVWAIDPDINNGYPYLLSCPPPVSDKDVVIAPTVSFLLGNYPNPFNPSTTIKFMLGGEMSVKIDVYNVRGQRVRSLVSGVYGAGSHTVVWNGCADDGVGVGSGVYFYHLVSGGVSEVRKMLLVK